MYPQTLREGSLISSTVWVRIFLCLYKPKEDYFWFGGGDHSDKPQGMVV